MNILRTLAFTLLSLALYTSCDDEDIKKDPISPVKTVVQFQSYGKEIKENDQSQTISIAFSKPLEEEAIISIGVDAGLTKYFTTTPAVNGKEILLNAKKGDTNASFVFTPLNNSTQDGNKLIGFTILKSNEAMQPGQYQRLFLTIKDDEAPGYLDFMHSPDTLLIENNDNWIEINLKISESSEVTGTALIEATSPTAVYGMDYVTEPAFINNQLTMSASPGNSTLKFKVRALNDSELHGHALITFTVKETSGNLIKGIASQESITLKDDELTGLPKAYTLGGGGWGMKKTFEYTASGKISKVFWETQTPYLRSGIDVYYYDNEDKLTKINTAPGYDLIYSYTSGRISMEQKVDHGIVKRYTMFDYDAAGNPAGYAIYYLQPDGKFALSSTTVLLYYTDGNLYKKMVYTHSSANPEEPYLVSTETFDNYLDKENPFQMVDVLPNIKTQKKLPATYRLEANGHDLLYNLTYQFNQNGKVIRRVTPMGYTSESAWYEYY
jgi:hypothetical protein